MCKHSGNRSEFSLSSSLLQQSPDYYLHLHYGYSSSSNVGPPKGLHLVGLSHFPPGRIPGSRAYQGAFRGRSPVPRAARLGTSRGIQPRPAVSKSGRLNPHTRLLRSGSRLQHVTPERAEKVEHKYCLSSSQGAAVKSTEISWPQSSHLSQRTRASRVPRSACFPVVGWLVLGRPCVLSKKRSNFSELLWLGLVADARESFPGAVQ